MSDNIILCAVQDSPVSFDLEATLGKVEQLTRQAASEARAKFHGGGKSTAKSADDALGQKEIAGRSGEKAGKGEQEPPIVVLFPEAFVSAYPRGLDVRTNSWLGSKDARS